jgi:hypothetical protein
MARSLWPQGIHVAFVVVDAVVDLPRTRFFPEAGVRLAMAFAICIRECR